MNNTVINPSSTSYNNEKITYMGSDPSTWLKTGPPEPEPLQGHLHHQEQAQIHYNTNIYNTVQYSAALYGHIPHHQQENDYIHPANNSVNISRLRLLSNNDNGSSAARHMVPNQQQINGNGTELPPKEEYLATTNNGTNDQNNLLYYQQQQHHQHSIHPSQIDDTDTERKKDSVIENYNHQPSQQDAQHLGPKNEDRESISVHSTPTDSSVSEEPNQKQGLFERIKLSENELEQISVRELNKLLQGQERELVSKVKAKRRTLKNRGYALKCRSRRVEIQNQLMIENKALKSDIHILKQQLVEWHNSRSELAYLRSEVCRLRTQLQGALEKATINESNFLQAPFYDQQGKLDGGGILRNADVSNAPLVPMNFAVAFDAVNRCLLSSVPNCCITPIENGPILSKVSLHDVHHPSTWNHSSQHEPQIEGEQNQS